MVIGRVLTVVSLVLVVLALEKLLQHGCTHIYDQGFFFLQCGVFGTVELGDVCACCMLLGQDSVMAHWICADQGE